MFRRSVIIKSLIIITVFVGVFPLLYFASIEIGIAEVAANPKTEPSDSTFYFDRFIENNSFGIGEKLTFEIGYGFITAGTATMEVKRLIEYENRPCYQITTRAESNSFFSSIYKVDDQVESIVDALGLFSWRFEKNLSEGNYRSHRQYDFDQRNNIVVYEKDTITLEPYIQDALSILYYVRTQPLEVGKSFKVESFVDGKKISVDVIVHKIEEIEVDAGTFECLVVEPISQSVGIFKHQGQLRVWLTNDRLKMPVLMKSKVLVGSISAKLTAFELGSLDEF